VSAPLRFGVLGAARIAALALVTPARATGDRLLAVAARDRHRAEAFAAEHGVERVLDDYAGVCVDECVEVVYNPLANALHGPWNLAAVAAGRHVLSEKPFASNSGEARRVADAAEAAGVTVLDGYHYLHHPVMRRLHELLDSGELGELRAVEAHVTMPAPPEPDPRWSLELAGGAVMDLGCYGLHAHRSLARWAGGEPAVTDARGAERPGHPGVDEWVEARLRYPGGATGFLRCSMNDDWRITLRVTGSAGHAEAANFVLPHRDDTVRVCPDGRGRTESLGTRSSYLYQLEAFRALVRGTAGTTGTAGELVPACGWPDARDAVRTAALIDHVYRAAGFEPRPSHH
jgi:predicted dehydrogenase